MRSEVWQPQTWTDVWQRRSQVGSGAPTTGSGKCLSFNASTSVDPCTLAPGWTNPTPEFLARAPRDPAVIKAQLAAAVPHSDAGVEQPAGTYAELVILRGAARANGLPADLSRALQRTAALLAPASPAHNLDGVPGTAYTLKGTNGVQLVVLFDADGTYLGGPTESVTRGAAAELGGPPVKLFP
ncbi:hypothetical protein [Amycolatopsis sp. NPDC050768]|uniref:hypothetical protein n=1 Tax=Amycolatopsis sp. NPDC050768 TaxID=3154839 RepID=UPI0033EA6EF9